MIFFTSDTHFGHANIIKYCNRPFATFGLMDRAMVDNWNAFVKPEDVVYHLGDFAYGRNATKDYIPPLAKELNGTIHLILGNHDKMVEKEWLSWRFASIKHYDEIEVEGQRIVLFHYGLRTWHHDLRGVWHLYGHSHGLLPAYGKSLDIGVDCWNFAPVSFDTIRLVMDAKPMGKHPAFERFAAAVSE